MSDEKPKPFAEVRPEISVADAEGFSVVIESYECCPPWGNWSEQSATDCAAAINAAVQARERAAAAKALRDAADMIESERSFGAGGMIAAMSRIRSRADAIERASP